MIAGPTDNCGFAATHQPCLHEILCTKPDYIVIINGY